MGALCSACYARRSPLGKVNPFLLDGFVKFWITYIYYLGKVNQFKLDGFFKFGMNYIYYLGKVNNFEIDGFGKLE